MPHLLENVREQAKSLEAAMAVCLAKPDKKPVHTLRTSIRRMEAQIQLLKQIKGLPPFRTQAADFLKVTKQIRRGAGEVRDMDVLRDLLEQMKGISVRDRQALDAVLKARRDQAAEALQKLLERKTPKIAKATEAFLKALKPAKKLNATVEEVMEVAKRMYTRRTRSLHLDDDDQLHTLRKSAKVARYMAETAEQESTQAKAVAKEYNRLQQAGGDWHDWLVLASTAKDELGKKSRLTTMAKQRRDRRLREFRKMVA